MSVDNAKLSSADVPEVMTCLFESKTIDAVGKCISQLPDRHVYVLDDVLDFMPLLSCTMKPYMLGVMETDICVRVSQHMQNIMATRKEMFLLKHSLHLHCMHCA
jgi:hypothetical protein